MIHLICPNPAIDRTLLLNSIKYSTPNRPIEVKEFPGGKSFNVAYALNYENQVNLTIHTMLGGINGEHLQQLANESGYQVKETIIEGNTRVCNILVDISKKEVIPVYEKGFELDSNTLEHFTNKLLNSIKNDDIIVFSGSLMKGMPSDYISSVYNQLLNRNISVKLCVDTSGQALVDTYNLTSPYLIKINDEEIKDLFPEASLTTLDDYLNLLKNDIKKDIPNFIITLGKDGIIARMNNTYYKGSSEPIHAKNPIACGDFFLGRVVRGFLTGDSDKEILQSALQFSTCNALNWYPEVKSEQLDSIFSMLTIEKI